ncbi:MAG: hypothetical protein AVDCRST_MAG79-2267, partial [uncultured Thermoleophilia bacterium]
APAGPRPGLRSRPLGGPGPLLQPGEGRTPLLAAPRRRRRAGREPRGRPAARAARGVRHRGGDDRRADRDRRVDRPARGPVRQAHHPHPLRGRGRGVARARPPRRRRHPQPAARAGRGDRRSRPPAADPPVRGALRAGRPVRVARLGLGAL